jgi:beta-galactosidase
MRSIRSAVAHGLRPRLQAGLVALLLLAASAVPVASQEVRIVSEPDGTRLQVDGEDFMVLGMNWDYFPRGTTYSYNFWGQPDALIQAALDREMGLMRTMGANTIRVYNGIPPRWVEYIYDTYGIYSVVNHAVGRFGVDLTGRYIPNTDYSDPATRAQLLGEVRALVEEFQGTRGVLMWLLGNENNYGLVWSSAETEDLPVGEADAVRARYLYSLFGEVVDAIKEIDTERPVAMANGDLQYLDIIAEEVDNLDIFGSNVYRGISFGDLFQRVKDTMGIPVVFTEFGADRFDAIRMREDQETQAKYLIGQWQEIYEQSAGKGRVGNAIGGMTFQWTRRLVEVRPGGPPGHPGHQRLLVQRRLPRGLGARREQHERGVVGGGGQGPHGSLRSLRTLPPGGLLRPEAGLRAGSLRPGHRPGGHP